MFEDPTINLLKQYIATPVRRDKFVKQSKQAQKGHATIYDY